MLIMHNNKMDIVDSFTDIASRLSQLKNRPGTECSIYIEGGASLFLHDIAETYRDVDWFIPDRWLKQNEIPSVNGGKNPFLVDIQTTHAPRDFKFDYSYNARPEKEVVFNGIKFILKSVLPEMIFLRKLDIGRDKDIIDLRKISEHITPMRIVDAINGCTSINNDGAILNIASQAISEISCLYYLDLKSHELMSETQKLIKSLNLNDYIKEDLANSFGLKLNKEYNVAKDPWKTKAIGQKHLSIQPGM